jgi:hypothetical protein
MSSALDLSIRQNSNEMTTGSLVEPLYVVHTAFRHMLTVFRKAPRPKLTRQALMSISELLVVKRIEQIIDDPLHATLLTQSFGNGLPRHRSSKTRPDLLEYLDMWMCEWEQSEKRSHTGGHG